jgi:predicted nucleotidyltransferase
MTIDQFKKADELLEEKEELLANKSTIGNLLHQFNSTKKFLFKADRYLDSTCCLRISRDELKQLLENRNKRLEELEKEFGNL